VDGGCIISVRDYANMELGGRQFYSRTCTIRRKVSDPFDIWSSTAITTSPRTSSKTRRYGCGCPFMVDYCCVTITLGGCCGAGFQHVAVSEVIAADPGGDETRSTRGSRGGQRPVPLRPDTVFRLNDYLFAYGRRPDHRSLLRRSATLVGCSTSSLGEQSSTSPAIRAARKPAGDAGPCRHRGGLHPRLP
jgi:hypothetical protein